MNVAPCYGRRMEDPPIGEALRLIRIRQGLTQQAASRLEGAADFRTLSHWETGRKLPSLRLLVPYLKALGLDLVDLQAALDQVQGEPSTATSERLAGLAARVNAIEGLSAHVECVVANVESLGGTVAELVSRLDALEPET